MLKPQSAAMGAYLYVSPLKIFPYTGQSYFKCTWQFAGTSAFGLNIIFRNILVT